MVQVRDEENHKPLPGIKLGEIGAKLGYNTVNNGFLGFDHHRIPRDRMLMKNAQVLKVRGKTLSTYLKYIMFQVNINTKATTCQSSLLNNMSPIENNRFKEYFIIPEKYVPVPLSIR